MKWKGCHLDYRTIKRQGIRTRTLHLVTDKRISGIKAVHHKGQACNQFPVAIQLPQLQMILW